MRWEEVGRTSCLTHSRFTGQHTKHPSACHLTSSYMAKLPSTRRAGAQGPLGHSKLEHGYQISWKKKEKSSW
jgi:hypothetical protein